MDQPSPHTAQSLASDLRALGVASGDVLLLHSSNRSLGFVVGGTQAVVQALLDVLGPEGTLVVPTHTPENTDPAGWQHPPVPEAWWPAIREQAPGFEPSCTPSRWMGVIAEAVRMWPGALRSDHPQVSFAALGMNAAGIVGGHQLDDALGETSPLGAVYRLNGKVLLLGCGYNSNTSLHLAEWRQKSPPRAVTGSSVRQPDGTSQWTTWVDIVADESDFDRLGADFEAAGAAVIGQVGGATAQLMSQPVLVDFATAWMSANRLPKHSVSKKPLASGEAPVLASS
ncbi:AAC(3) family N-acetyltransferase [Micromonospora musae]|uniref:Aminoglycoside N(3)-acetyltransferase n=1 Tax=Micromonospora musae TaxID=1894970 RepID=A0A3A9Y3Q9_9ACTN|nr:AAC(3) family N-acetyltransferase [Micromonospora musae]RKN32400.1 aminoglycoside N(3)-acetyltransferase [Micromonospora musae]